MKRKVFALLLAASLVSASISPVAADDFTIEMQEESQDIAFDEPEFAEENPVVEDVAQFEEEDVSNEEDSAAGFEEEDNEEDKTPSDDIVVEDSYDEDFAGEDETLAETQIENEELAEETVNLAEGSIPIDERPVIAVPAAPTPNITLSPIVLSAARKYSSSAGTAAFIPAFAAAERVPACHDPGS